MSEKAKNHQMDYLRDDAVYKSHLEGRQLRGSIGRGFFYLSFVVAMFFLVVLFLTIINDAIGTVGFEDEVPLTDLVPSGNMSDLTVDEIITILDEQAAGGLRVVIRDNLSTVANDQFAKVPVEQALGNSKIPAELVGKPLDNQFPKEGLIQIIKDNISRLDLEETIIEKVVGRKLVGTYTLNEALFNYPAIEQKLREKSANVQITRFYVWLTPTFLVVPMDSDALQAGIRTAILGSFLMMIMVVVIALPIGVGAAIYLEEYASDNWINNFIETNVRNLAGVPSIIYGMLGLAIFVRTFGDLTGGRTIISGALTLALLVMPVIIISSQEALRAVPRTIREASYGLGATKWQTISRQILPAAIPSILTGLILAVSRALGETAPLIVVGAASFVVFDPSLTSRFTVLPIQVYQWTSRPQPEFRNIAAAAIIVLLLLNITLNATAIILRNRYSKKL